MFHPLCYGEGISFDLNNEKGRITKLQINEFGQVPNQLFNTPHPVKYSKQIRDISLIMPYKEQEPIDDSQTKRVFNHEKPKSKEKENNNQSLSQLKQETLNEELISHNYQTRISQDKDNKDNDDNCNEYKNKYNFTKKYSQIKNHHKK